MMTGSARQTCATDGERLQKRRQSKLGGSPLLVAMPEATLVTVREAPFLPPLVPYGRRHLEPANGMAMKGPRGVFRPCPTLVDGVQPAVIRSGKCRPDKGERQLARECRRAQRTAPAVLPRLRMLRARLILPWGRHRRCGPPTIRHAPASLAGPDETHLISYFRKESALSCPVARRGGPPVPRTRQRVYLHPQSTALDPEPQNDADRTGRHGAAAMVAHGAEHAAPPAWVWEPPQRQTRRSSGWTLLRRFYTDGVWAMGGALPVRARTLVT